MCPSGIPACSQNGIRPHRYEAFHPEGGDLHLPICKLLHGAESRGSEAHDLTAFVVDVSL